MKRFLIIAVWLLAGLGLAQSPSPAFAALVDIYVDSAPNKYGSPDYAAWESSAFSAAADGTFVNMANGINPANVETTDFEIQDEVVYSFGDLGKRLTFIYYVAGETIATLPTKNFLVGMTNDWNGTVLDYYQSQFGSTWLEPTQWQDHDADGDGTTDGVIGAAGVAWWGAKDVDTQAALDADVAFWGLAEETWTFTAQMDGVEYALEANRAPVPLPTAVILLGSGLIGLAGFRRKIRR